MIASGQDINDRRITARYRNQPVSVLLEQLKREQQIQIFYQPQWIDTLTVRRDFEETPLVQVFNSLLQGSNFTWRIFQDDAIVVLPLQEADRRRYVDELQLLVIGNPLNQGRYRKVLFEGRVVDGKSGDPLPGAVIMSSNIRQGFSTDASGKFSIELETGDHTLQISFMGFQPGSQRIRLIEGGYAEFELFEESLSIGEITVRGEAADLPRSQMSMVRMETRVMKNLPALMGEVDVVRGLSMQPGIQTVSELSSGFNVRGGNTDQNLMLLNGSPIFNASHLFGFLSLINPDLVDNFRLFKGGMPARYGERVSSVMEVDLRDGNEDRLELTGGLGIINSRLAANGPLTKDKKLLLTAGGRSSYTDWILSRVPNPDISQSVARFYDLAGKLTYKFNARNRISGMAYLSHDAFSTSAQTITEYSSQLLNLQARNSFSSKLTGEGNLSYSNYRYQLTDLASGKDEEAYYLNNQLKYGSMRYNMRYRPHPNHTIEGGLNAIYYGIRPGEVSGVSDTTLIVPRILQQEQAAEWAGYLADEYEISPALSVSAGLRISGFAVLGTPVVYLYDETRPKSAQSVVDSLLFGSGEISKSFVTPEPRLMVRYETPSGHTWKLNFQRVSQYLFQISNSAVISPAETWKISDHHLSPLISDQAALGFEHRTLENLVELGVELYYKRLQNLLEYKNGAELLMNPHIETSIVPADGYAVGAEFQARKSMGRLTGWMNYTFSRTMRRTLSEWSEEQLWDGGWYPSQYDRPHDLTAVATYNISRRWRFTGNFTYMSGRPVTLPERQYSYAGETLIFYSERNKYRMPAYHRMDVALTFDENLRKKRMWKGSWTLSVYNLYGRHNPYSVYYRKTVPSAENSYRGYSLFKLSVIGIPVPSLTYNFKF